MKNNAPENIAGEVRHVQHFERVENANPRQAAAVAIPIVPAYALGSVVKRFGLQITQAALDAGIFWLCIHAAMILRASASSSAIVTTIGFGPERMIFLSGVMLICFFFNDLYEFKSWMFWDEMREVLKASITTLLIFVVYMYALKLQLSRLVIFSGMALFTPTCLLARYLFRRLSFACGQLQTPILIIGAGKTGELYAKKLLSHPFMGCKVKGFLDDDHGKVGTMIAGSPVLGRVDDFAEIQNRLAVDEVVIAVSTANRELLAHMLDTVEMRVKRVSYIPDMYMLTTFSASIRDVDGLPLISASQGLLNPMNRMIKNVMDYVGALLALVLFSPLFLYVAFKIRRDDGGVIFFTQDRVGKDLELFKVYKFRTMVADAEKMLPEMLKDEHVKKEYEVAFKLKEDPRVTRVGRFLRKSSLDELPQLFNVLKGEMSLIGPRPFVPSEIETRYGEAAHQIYRVKPGLSGLWQVSGRNDILDYQHSRDLDLYYIYNWSPWLDIVIIFRTVQILLNAHGAY